MQYSEKEEQLKAFKEYLQQKKYSSKTRTSIGTMCSYYLDWLEEQGIEAANVGYNDILSYVNFCQKNGNIQRTIQIKIMAVKHFYNLLFDLEMVSVNPAQHVKTQGIKRTKLYYVLEPIELENTYKNYTIVREYKKNVPPQIKQTLARKRNKIMLGLLIYQGLRTEELERITLSDFKPREGKIYIAGSLRTNARTLKLETFQVFDMMDYIHETRKEILAIRKIETQQFFISLQAGMRFNSVMQKFTKAIRIIEPKINGTKHIRASVITNWLSQYNLRKTQYMAGHRYVSSTEKYKLNDITELQSEINQYHPIT